MDKLNPARLIGLINENIKKGNVEIGQIEILKNFSFFEIDKKVADEVLKGFRNVEFEGRGVIVEVTTKPKNRSRSRKRGGFGGGRRSGGSRDGGRNKRSSFSGSGQNRNYSGRRRSRNR
jgi:ATP-dependent RNA helicase DeaD